MAVPNLTNDLAGDLKTISQSGQISLGKAFAGQRVLLQQLADGRWLVTPVRVIPTQPAWVDEQATTERLEEYLAWKRLHPASESDLQALAEALAAKTE
jgi:hypothetical protein